MPRTPIDPVTLAVIRGRLEGLADEMDATLFRSAFNPIIAEAHDASHGIYHRDTGATLVQGTSGLPIFVGAMSFAVRAVIDKVNREGGAVDGDVFVFNDPYDGGCHLSCGCSRPASCARTWSRSCRRTRACRGACTAT
jgi:N-methylhydantoinase B